MERDRVEGVRKRDATRDCCCRRGAFPNWRVASLLSPRAREEEAIASAGAGAGKEKGKVTVVLQLTRERLEAIQKWIGGQLLDVVGLLGCVEENGRPSWT